MEIFEILKNSGKELYMEDLQFFKTELDTGDYSENYVAECKNLIKMLEGWLLAKNKGIASEEKTDAKRKAGSGKKLELSPEEVAPSEANGYLNSMDSKTRIFYEIKKIRGGREYRHDFKEYVKKTSEINGEFIDKNYSFFMPWEIDAIVSVKELEEEFLEKYFGALDKKKIARYQRFSESFFMKHFSQMDATIVLAKGKNEWRKKEKRSSQLDVFLRLKGVKI